MVFFYYHGNQITMKTNFNILGDKIPRVFWNRTLNHLSIINVNKATKRKHEKC